MKTRHWPIAILLTLATPTLSAAEIPPEWYNGVWYNEQLGYIISNQNADRLAGALLPPTGQYLAFLGRLRVDTAPACTADTACPRAMVADMAQLFVDSTVTLAVDFGPGSLDAPPTQATLTLTTCQAVARCLIPINVPFTAQKIF